MIAMVELVNPNTMQRELTTVEVISSKGLGGSTRKYAVTTVRPIEGPHEGKLIEVIESEVQ
jgi:hypothetical protein